jgi:hypothetical protein
MVKTVESNPLRDGEDLLNDRLNTKRELSLQSPFDQIYFVDLLFEQSTEQEIEHRYSTGLNVYRAHPRLPY